MKTLPFLFLLLAGSLNQDVPGERENFTLTLTQSTASYQLWTTPPSEHVFEDDVLPDRVGSAIHVYAAKNETEPFQLIIKPAASGAVPVSISDFGSGISTDIYRVSYVTLSSATDYLGTAGDAPDPLLPLENGDAPNLTAGQNTALWFSLKVPSSAPAGDYAAIVTVGSLSVPVLLHVFNFTLPEELHVKSQMNFNKNTVLSYYDVPGTRQ